MNYNLKDKKNKIEQITALETNALQDKSSSEKPSKTTKAPSDKKNLTLYVSEGLIKEIDDFLSEYGNAKETRNYFFEESLRHYLTYRKSQLEAELEEKLKKLKKNRI
ncbi:hypothetical protein LS71_008225 [Helicobacter jaachi]|uniref:Uncharacterized protein n=1 Tax=Helicobacter jaachi TaxID=1677920 RepID=A0A4U8T753_9HELI|nr:hypothetical protein [Helicobacter jaachi]TLD95383.1 hypothetical protein LS71_008225 [Helicobacter jaachi]